MRNDFMKLQEILMVKGSLVYTIGPEATLLEVVETLVEHRIGALVVCRGGAAGREELLGIITERDILHWCGAGSRPLGDVKAGEAMSPALITSTPDDEVERIMGLMTTHRIRHLPVLCEGRLAGMISIGDVVKAQHDRLAMENRFMKDYIGGQ
jgi:CBS domain-containing protein